MPNNAIGKAKALHVVSANGMSRLCPLNRQDLRLRIEGDAALAHSARCTGSAMHPAISCLGASQTLPSVRADEGRRRVSRKVAQEYWMEQWQNSIRCYPGHTAAGKDGIDQHARKPRVPRHSATFIKGAVS